MATSSELNNIVCKIGKCIKTIEMIYELKAGELSNGQKEKINHDYNTLKGLMDTSKQ